MDYVAGQHRVEIYGGVNRDLTCFCGTDAIIDQCSYIRSSTEAGDKVSLQNCRVEISQRTACRVVILP